MPELNPFIISAVRTLFFLAPGLVALDEVYGRTHDVLIVNPLTGLFEAYRAMAPRWVAEAWDSKGERVAAIVVTRGRRPADDTLLLAEKAGIPVFFTDLNSWQVASHLYEAGIR